MSWFRQNRFLGTSLIVFGIAVLAALYFVWSARSSSYAFFNVSVGLWSGTSCSMTFSMRSFVWFGSSWTAIHA